MALGIDLEITCTFIGNHLVVSPVRHFYSKSSLMISVEELHTNPNLHYTKSLV